MNWFLPLAWVLLPIGLLTFCAGTSMLWLALGPLGMRMIIMRHRPVARRR